MRKRKYAHLRRGRRVEDCLTEEIDAFYAAAVGAAAAGDAGTPATCIHNLVGTANIESSQEPFDLLTISRVMPNATYDKQKFAAITIRMLTPVCTVLLFTSGKMVLTGCKSLMECFQASHEIVLLLSRNLVGVRFRLRCVQIQNIVGNVDLGLGAGASVDLDSFYRDMSVFCTYQKNMFPGLIYRANYSPVVLLVFQSGKIVITGGRSTRDIQDGWRQLWPVVRRYVREGRA
jgi:transcription initiation factor TFIID TATA-box-binding protein